MSLFKAVIENDLRSFVKQLRSGADPQRPNASGFTPLQLARFLHRRELLDKLDPCRKRQIRLGNLKDERVCTLSIEEFERAAGIVYLSHLHFASYEQLERLRRYLLRGRKRFAAESRWLTAYYQPDIKNQTTANLVIRWIDEGLGYGLFAGEAIYSQQYLGEYTGRVRSARWFERGELDYSFQYPGRSRLGQRTVVDAAEAGNEMRYINHSEAPNCEAIALYSEGIVRIGIRAIRQIAKGEQLTLDYGERYWRKRRRKGEAIRQI